MTRLPSALLPALIVLYVAGFGQPAGAEEPEVVPFPREVKTPLESRLDDLKKTADLGAADARQSVGTW